MNDTAITDAELEAIGARVNGNIGEEYPDGSFADPDWCYNPNDYERPICACIPLLLAEVRRLREFSADFSPGNTLKFISPIGGGTFKIKVRLGNEFHLVGMADDIDD